MDSETALDKARKLLAIARRTDNIHEAEVTARRAAAIMAEHRISEAMLHRDPTRPEAWWDDPLDTSKSIDAIPMWKIRLAQALAPIYGCVMFMSEEDDGAAICLVGTEDDRNSVTLLFQWLRDETHRLCTSALRRERGRKKMSRSAAAAFRESFYDGAVETFSERLREEVRKIRTALQGAEPSGQFDGVGLVPINQALARLDFRLEASKSVFQSMNPDAFPDRDNLLDWNAWFKGRAASNLVDLSGHRDKLATTEE